MHFDGKTLTTPPKIDQKVASFCRKLSTQSPVFLDVKPELWSRQCTCEMNVEKYIEEHGGEKLFGFKIWYIKNKYIEAERHVVLKNDSELIDLTFNTDGETKILFVPDASNDFDSKPPKFRQGFTVKAKKFAEFQNLQDKNIERMSNEESWDNMLTYEQWLAGDRMTNMWVKNS
ncbi:hypothetical protein HII17_03400 [Thalassotalea sp. M1531]|uniref:Uncharacterized protein n=1 Tax=Thalassotalea algicola TaxID=2716224 RepID=A0A7Y0L9T0_9GAMM|nr:hypothetical protein [Thalassotalea algicola]NMP30598.1 hypothetical protein [Thalassotalea algicola]